MLAEKLDVSRQSVSKWESGQALPDSDKVLAMAELFGVSTDFLLRDTEEFVADEEVHSWEVLRNPAYHGKILMKDAYRDVYTALLTALNKEALDSGEKQLRTLAFDTSEESIALVENYLCSFKESICGWEADFGK